MSSEGSDERSPAPTAAQKEQTLQLADVSDQGDIDYSDPVAVRDLICRIHPFGDIFSYEGIVEACRLGRGRELVAIATPPDIPQPDSVPLAEMIDPPAEWVMSNENLKRRASVILATGFYGTDEAHRAAIESVRDAGVVGLLAQANLQPPTKPKRRRSKGSFSHHPAPVRGIFRAFSNRLRTSGLVAR